MKKLFIVGTGRNGSKLTGKVIGTAVSSEYRYGEIHHGLDPVFFKDGYLGSISKEQVIRRFKSSRDKPMSRCNKIYVEKNHLVVPILNQVLEAYPDALFLYVSRHPKDVIRSFYSRNVYKSSNKNKYEIGRLVPNKNDKYYKLWDGFNRFEKSCWYVSTMMSMCEKFIHYLPRYQYRIVAYENFVKDHSVFKEVFEWLELEFDLEKRI